MDYLRDLQRHIPTYSGRRIASHHIVFALFNLGRKEESAATLAKFLKNYPADNRGLFTQALLARLKKDWEHYKDALKVSAFQPSSPATETSSPR